MPDAPSGLRYRNLHPKQLLIIQAPCTLAEIYNRSDRKHDLYDAWGIFANQFEKIKDDYTVIILVKDKNANNAYDWEYSVIGNERGTLRW